MGNYEHNEDHYQPLIITDKPRPRPRPYLEDSTGTSKEPKIMDDIPFVSGIRPMFLKMRRNGPEEKKRV